MEIVTINSERDLAFLQAVISTAIANGQDVHFAVEGGLKVKRGGSVWSAPLGVTHKRG